MRFPSWLFVLAFLALSACSRPERPTTATASTSSAPTLTYLGTAGWVLHGPSGTLLVDPYVTRAPVEDDAVPLVPDEAAIAAFTPARVDAILVGHSHYDHVLDVGVIARRTGASIVGTESTVHLALAAGIPAAQLHVARGGEEYPLGPFAVRTVRALHSLTGQANVTIPANVKLPLAARDYGEGGTLQYLVRFEGHAVYFVGTANFVEEALTDLRPDVAVIAVGLRRKVPDYTCRLLHALGNPPRVLPNHFDAFREPLRPGHMESSADTRADLDAFVAEVHACSPTTRVEIPVHLRPIAL